MQFVPIPKEHLDNMWQYVEPIIIKAVGLTPDRIDTKNILAFSKRIVVDKLVHHADGGGAALTLDHKNLRNKK